MQLTYLKMKFYSWMKYIINNSIEMFVESCYTTGGGTTGAACVFPFIFRDKLRNSCTWDDAESEKPWCSIRVDEEGYHIGNEGLWGYCSSYCPVESSKL